MSEIKEWLFAALVCTFCMVIGAGYGAKSAGRDIATRCERLGNFIGDDKAFTCAPKEAK
jgi:hypothetical protein